MMTLTVDSSAKPVDLIPMRQAVGQIAAGTLSEDRSKFQILLSDETTRFRSQKLDIPAPLVIMFPGYIELNNSEVVRVSRKIVFARDKYTCQYCGWLARPGSSGLLTIDHVKPIHLFPNRIEATTWENCVTACRECNLKKGGKLPRECKMMPATTPREPHYVQLRFAGRVSEEQRDYILDYYGEKAKEWL